MVEIYISVKADTHITTNVHLVAKLGLSSVHNKHNYGNLWNKKKNS